MGGANDDRSHHFRAEGGLAVFSGFWDNRGWGFGLSVFTRRDDIAGVPGRFGWDGGYGTSGLHGPQRGPGRNSHDPAPVGLRKPAAGGRWFLDSRLFRDPGLENHRVDAVRHVRAMEPDFTCRST